MEKQTIHFAHANGFPAACYSEFLQPLSQDFQIIAKPVLAHDENFPIQENWNTSADEVIAYIEQNAAQPVVGMGHSFGGTVTMKAAAKRPDLFSHLILLDPVVVVGSIPVLAAKLLKRFGKIGAVTPADKTEGRRRTWQTREEAFQYFKGKSLFKDFTDKSIRLYVEQGLKESEDGFSLIFNVSNEVKIFKSVPTDLCALSKIKTPGIVLGGITTDVAKPFYTKRLSRKHGFQTGTVSGGHMFPFEFPEETARSVSNWLN